MTVQKLTTRRILERNLSRTPPPLLKHLKIWIHDIRSMHNVGAVFRSADAFGISEVLISGFTPYPPRPEISKTAIGAEKYVSWRQDDDPGQILSVIRNSNYLLAGIEQTDQSIELPDYNPPVDQPICLLFGNEVTGIAEELLPEIDTHLEIPQYGHKHSLNISVSVGTVLYGLLQKCRE